MPVSVNSITQVIKNIEVLRHRMADIYNPDKFSTLEEQSKERKRLFSIIKELVKWENINNSLMFDQAIEEIRKSTNNNPPLFLDPFCGGGSIPLEAQRLGLNSYAREFTTGNTKEMDTPF